MNTEYAMPSNISAPTTRYDVAANIAFFLLENGLQIFDDWAGRMSAADQRKLFGLKLGKGLIYISGSDDSVQNRSKTCYGQDSEATVWMNCQEGHIGRNFFTLNATSAHEREIEAAKEWFHA